MVCCVLCCDSSAVCASAAGWGCWEGHSSWDMDVVGKGKEWLLGCAFVLSVCSWEHSAGSSSGGGEGLPLA